jgi:hypothetical protein
MRAAALLALLATPALAETDASALIAAEGLRGAEAALAALPAPTPSERFALGGVRFLGGVERALQLRYQVGLSGGLAEMSGLPVLRLPLPDNPSPAPFEPEMIEALFAGLQADMAGSLDALGAIADDDAVAVPIDLADLWFDIDADGARAPGEGLLDVAGTLLGGGFGEPPAPVTIRFDTADAAWLAAYAHLLGGVGEAVLAVDPSEAIGRVLDARAGFRELGLPPPDPYGFGMTSFADYADLAAMVLFALDGPPDPARTRALRDHLLACVEQNRRFWTLVAREADNDAEWIPSKRQASATGIPFPPDTGRLWLDVLAEADGVLRGDLLIPFWRVGPGVGIDLGAVLQDPPSLDFAGLVQGAALTPYLRRGKVADGEALMRFAMLAQGDAALYAAMLN